MGDSGSTALGFSVAFLSLDYIGARGAGGVASSWLFPFLLAALPLLDALVVVTRRVMKGRSPFQGDRGHFYDFLLAVGWPARSVAICCYFLTGFLGLLGRLVVQVGIQRSLIFGVGIFGALVVTALYLGARRQGAVRHSRYRAQL